jgi:hypothetical protein
MAEEGEGRAVCEAFAARTGVDAGLVSVSHTAGEGAAGNG